jgi:hypothetical protein
MEVAGLGIQAKESVHAELRGTNLLAESRDQLGRPPVSDLKIPAFSKTPTNLVVKATDTENIGHLHQGVCPATKNAPDFRERGTGVPPGEMLEHAVGKDLVECLIMKWKVPAIRNNIRSRDAQLLGYAISRSNALEGGVNSNRAVTRPSRGDAPAPPIAAHFKKEPVLAWWKAKRGNRVFREVANKMLIETAVGGANRILHERIDVVRTEVEVWQRRGISALGNGQGARTFNVCLLGI